MTGFETHAVLQPDQDPARWDRFVDPYEQNFEPLTDQFVAQAVEALGPLVGRRVLDICAGTGGGAIKLAEAGAIVTAIDASLAMVARTRSRATERVLDIKTSVMDASTLDLPSAGFDVALSCFGIVLLPDPHFALQEALRILKPGGRLAVITWTDPHAYELAVRLTRAAEALGWQRDPSAPLPAQLRYADPVIFGNLIEGAGFTLNGTTRIDGLLVAPSARCLADHLSFAPGLDAMLASFGDRKEAIVETFIRGLEKDHGQGPVALTAVAQMAAAIKPA